MIEYFNSSIKLFVTFICFLDPSQRIRDRVERRCGDCTGEFFFFFEGKVLVSPLEKRMPLALSGQRRRAAWLPGWSR